MNLTTSFVKRAIPFFPSGEKLDKARWHIVIRFIFMAFAIFCIVGSALLIKNADNSLLINFVLYFMMQIAALIFINFAALLYRFFLLLLNKKYIKQKDIEVIPISKNAWILLLIQIIIFLILWMILQYHSYVLVSKTQNFNMYYDNLNDTDSYISMSGDWDDDSKLAKEVTKHDITCTSYEKVCKWLTASIQEWNDNYLIANMEEFPIVEWNKDIIRAKEESDNRTEEITFYRKSCKMVYVKTPKGESGSSLIPNFTPEPIVLTMTDSRFCN